MSRKIRRLRRRSVLRLPSARIAVVILAAILFLAIFGSALAPQNPLTINSNALFQGPSRAHLLGTDYLGRDVLSRLMAGTRLSVLTALEAVGIGLVIGAPLGVATVFLGRCVRLRRQPGRRRADDAAVDLLRRGGHRGPRQRPRPGDVPGGHPADPLLLPDHQGGHPRVRARPVRGGRRAARRVEAARHPGARGAQGVPDHRGDHGEPDRRRAAVRLVPHLPRHRRPAADPDLGRRALLRPRTT